MRNLQVVLASRPSGFPTAENFRIVESGVPQPAAGQVLVRNHWLSLDPYMRMRMNAAKSYAKRAEINEVMIGGTLGEVIASRNPRFEAGEFVTGSLGWQLYALSDGTALRKVDARAAPLSHYLGVLGMPGVTAWMGLLDMARPRAGETVVVSAAAGAVGSVAGQLARIHGCRVVGIAGGAVKCAHVVQELGFDACVDYKAGALREDLERAAPDGVDLDFENVGGEVLDAVLALANPFARVTVCGLVSQYNATEPYAVRNFGSVLVNRIRVQGFIVSDRLEVWPGALHQLAGWYAEGKLKYHETVAHGLESAPRAFIGMLRGENLGKQVVRLGEA
ncbi:MAG: NADP-dependent oxidoreductase [Burkholderiales bacterium]|nr:NADP-dependent oxidoreductase [Burkholderiales bacterium]